MATKIIKLVTNREKNEVRIFRQSIRGRKITSLE